MLDVLAMFLSTPDVLTFTPDHTRTPPVLLPSFGAQALATLLRERRGGQVPGIFGALHVHYQPLSDPDLPDVRGYVHLKAVHVNGSVGSAMLDDTLDNLDVLADCLTSADAALNSVRWGVTGIKSICTVEVSSFRLPLSVGKPAVVQGAWRLEIDQAERPQVEGMDIVNTGCGLAGVPSWDLVLPLKDGRRVSACPSALGRIIRAGLDWREVLATAVQAVERAA